MMRRVKGNAVRPPARRLLALGDGWSAWDVVCDAGPRDHPFEEQLSNMCVAIVAAGTFQYRAAAGRELMTPGSLLLGNAGQHFECGHEHGVGDRCISFSYEQRYFDGIAAEAGVQERNVRFSTLRVPAVRELSSLVVRACIGLSESGVATPSGQHGAFGREGEKSASPPPEDSSRSYAGMTAWEEIGIELVGRALALEGRSELGRGSGPAAEERVTRVIRRIERHPESDHRLGTLAQEAKLSRYHFLRVFGQLTGLTPHQYVLRTRLRRAATRLTLEPHRVVDVALDSGYGDVSNFNHAFRTEFGVSPRSFRKSARNRMGLAAAIAS